MKQKSPIKAVNKKQRTTVRQSAAGNRKGKKTQKKMSESSLPDWAFRLLLAVVAVLFMAGFYFFCIRPYAYRWKPCAGVQEYGVCMPVAYQVHGIDISHYQGFIDWELLRKAQSPLFPLKFVFVKATEGGDLSDDRFVYNFSEARKNGFIRGAYHFFIPSTPPQKQAEFFIKNVQLEAGDLPPVLDVELRGNRSAEQLKTDVRTWLALVERHYGVRPILYTGYKFKMKYLSDTVFNKYPYWIAHYYVDSVRYKGDWRFWQHTDAGLLPGVSDEVDLNVFNGSLEELKSMTIH